MAYDDGFYSEHFYAEGWLYEDGWNCLPEKHCPIINNKNKTETPAQLMIKSAIKSKQM